MKLGLISVNEIGLSFGLLCEKKGHEVLVSNSNDDYVFNLNQNICITNEPLIQSMLFDTTKFSATTSNAEVIKNSDIIFIFSPTPSNIDGNYDTTKVFDVVSEFYSLSSQNVSLYNKKVVICSTTNPGEVSQIQERLNMFNIQVAYNPFFTNDGEIVKDIENHEMVLIGGEYQELINDLISLHTELKKVLVNVYTMSSKAAELTKISINSFLSVKITYANMLGEIITKSGVEDEVDMVLTAIGGNSGIGQKHMKYGFGYGGPTINGDNKSLKHFANSIDANTELIASVDTFNKSHISFLKEYYIQKNPNKEVPFVMNHITYKKGTNVIEESQQFQLCIDLLNEGYTLNVIEIPEVAEKLTSLSESYDGRLKFFPIGTKPEGYEIKLN
jgi:nucleotide sugar dehydrogenase